MQPCAFTPCNNPAEVDHALEAPFSMFGTSSLSRQIVKICKPCDSVRKILDKAPGQLNIIFTVNCWHSSIW